LDTRTVSLRTSETTSGNLVADCLFAFFNGHGADPDLGMINGGFIRGDRLYPEDGIDITRRFLNEEMPFPKNACCVEITGGL
jgi:5'-nucleotidase / UDP-sugar diphosphatase